jgi:hypothetical protein
MSYQSQGDVGDVRRLFTRSKTEKFSKLLPSSPCRKKDFSKSLKENVITYTTYKAVIDLLSWG